MLLFMLEERDKLKMLQLVNIIFRFMLFEAMLTYFQKARILNILRFT
jgi:hypothetical protein